MWTCPRCERQFKTTNQSHSCVQTTIDDLFAKRPDHLLLAFDTLLTQLMDWEPISVGPSKNTVVFTNRKAFLIIRPMQKVLDIKFYYDEALSSERIHKITEYNGKYAHHIRIQDEIEIDEEILGLIRQGYQFAMR